MDQFERPKTYVQWMLGNSCNYNCSYCLDLLKRGDFPPPDEELFIEICKDIIYHYDDLGRDVIFEFIGGEPTLMKKIPELGQRLHNYPTNIVLRTNGSASLDWWKKSSRFLSEVVISVHREFADVDHIKSIVELLQESKNIHPIKLNVLFPVTVRPESWEWGVKCVNKFRKRYGVGELQLLYSNFGRGSDMHLPYKDEQWDEYHLITNTKRKYNAPRKIVQPSYKGLSCHAGIDTLIIDAMGNIFRGWCLQGGKIGNINDSIIKWPTEKIICEADTCKNGFDQKARKDQL